MKLAKRLLFVTALISAFLMLSAFAAEETLLISPAPKQSEEVSADKLVFPDIPEDASYAESVYKLSNAGVLNGYEDGSFRPEGEVTRAEMAKMVILTFGLAEKHEGAQGFPDVKETDWFYPYVLAIQNIGLVNGYENGDFRPSNSITRAETCAIIYRMFEDDGDKKKVLETSPFIPGMPDRKINDFSKDPWANKYIQTIINNYLMPLEKGGTFRPDDKIKRYELADLLAKFVIEAPEILTADVRFFVGDEQWGETEVVAIGDAANVPQAPYDKAPEGYGFKGWKIKGTDNVIEVEFNTITEAGTLDYEAVFVKEWTVKFMNGSEVYEIQTVLDGDYAEKPNNPKWGNMKFEGWSEDDSGVVENTVYVNLSRLKITRNYTLYARYSQTGIVRPDGPGPDGPSNPNSDEFMTILEDGAAQLEKVRDATTRARVQYICNVVIDFIGDVTDDANDGNLVDKDYVNKHYGTLVNAVKLYILEAEVVSPLIDPEGKGMGFNATDANTFKNLLGQYVTDDVQDFIVDYFDIDMSQFQ